MRSIFSEISNLTNSIRIHNQSYYSDGLTIVSDAEYDDLKLRHSALAQEAGLIPDITDTEGAVLKAARNLLDSVNHAELVEASKLRHLRPMLSLSNASTEDEIQSFLARMERLHNAYCISENLVSFDTKDKNIKDDNIKDESLKDKASALQSFIAELKIDGVSFSAMYQDGRLMRALTRGDGQFGEDITQNIRHLIDLPLEIDSKRNFEIRGEAYIANSDFENINKAMVLSGKKPFANSRNAAAGSIRLLDHNLVKERMIRYFAWDCFVYDAHGQEIDFFTKQIDAMRFLKKNNFTVNDEVEQVSSSEEIEKFYSTVLQKRALLDYDIDGIVLKVNSRSFQRYMGSSNTSPRWAIAYKFPSAKAWSRLEDIVLQISRYGVLTPVAKIAPINIGGVLVSRATLHNMSEIRRKDICIGDLVCVKRAGDVIPKIESIDYKARAGNEVKFVFPDNCPFCNTKLINCGRAEDLSYAGRDSSYVENSNEDDLAIFKICPNGRDCLEQNIESIVHFASREAFDIEGLGDKQIKFLFENHFIENEVDIFTLKAREFQSLDQKLKLQDCHGWGAKSVDNLAHNIQKSRSVTLARLIYALSIPHVGIGIAVSIAEYAKDLEGFEHFASSTSNTSEQQIPGIGETTMQSIREHFIKHGRKLLYALKEYIQITEERQLRSYFDGFNSSLYIELQDKFRGKNLVITGSVQNYTRDQLKELFRQLGAKVGSSVSRNTDYLLFGSDAGQKLLHAHERKVPTIDLNTLLNQRSDNE